MDDEAVQTELKRLHKRIAELERHVLSLIDGVDEFWCGSDGRNEFRAACSSVGLRVCDECGEVVGDCHGCVIRP